MSPKLKDFLLRWLINTVAVLVASNLIRGIHYDNYVGLFVAAFMLGILNTFLRPLLMWLSLPLLILSLGLFTFVINGFLLYLVGSLMKTFRVESFSAAFWGALVISLISGVLNMLAGTGNSRIQVRRSSRPPPRREDDNGGPIIDV
jgi:putative membrane protein